MSGTVDGERVYEIVTTGLAQQQAIKNVYYYRISAGAGTLNALTLSSAFAADIQPTIRLALSDIYQEESIVVRELNSDLDFSEQPLAGAGAVTGDFLPLYAAAVVKLLREDKTTGNGRKMYGPIGEDDQQDGDLDISGQLSFDNIAGLLNDQLILSGRTFDPVIIGNKRTAAGASVPESAWQWNTIVTAQALTLLGTQNSRKRRRGV